jgi:hypothetical protein
VTPPAKLFLGDDVHAKAGFTCVFCHGGDGTADDQELAHDKKKGFIGAGAATSPRSAALTPTPRS